MRRMLFALALIWSALAASALADEVTPNDEVVSGVIIRAEANTSSARLGLMRPGDVLTIDGDESGWWRVRVSADVIGYVSKRWTTRIATTPTQPTTESLVESRGGAMYAHFVYVGQGAGAILEFPCGVALIDTGGQFRGPTDGGHLFVEYLDEFFEARPHLNDTIDVVFTSHPHADHLKGLPYLLDDDGVPRYTIRNVVDNGRGVEGSERRQREFRDAVRRAGGRHQGVTVTNRLQGGFTNDIIDPIDCGAAGDPEFSVLWGAWSVSTVRRLGGLGRTHGNPNQHSLVLRVDFGEASFLFTGDLMEHGIHDLLEVQRGDLSVLDVDVYHVGHHGADNGTTAGLLAAMTPELAIISVGDLEEDHDSTATAHAHPRTSTLALLLDGATRVSATRDPIVAWGFDAHGQAPVEVTIDRAVYATGWEGDLILRATLGGDYTMRSAPD